MAPNSKSDNVRIYTRDSSAIFKRTSERWGGLSNMAPGYPLYVNGLYIRSSEALYQACRYPNDPEVQMKILSQTSPMTAKMVGEPHRENTRGDWEKLRIVIMKWCLRVKLAQNYERFSSLLIETKDLPIVEISNKDDFWGAKPADSDTLIGVNALGRLLMELRVLVKSKPKEDLSVVPVPCIDNFLLIGEEVREVRSTDVKHNSGSQDSLFNV